MRPGYLSKFAAGFIRATSHFHASALCRQMDRIEKVEQIVRSDGYMVLHKKENIAPKFDGTNVI